MYHALTILLHRPFVSGGHLGRDAADTLARDALAHCDGAATQIDAVLRCYKTAYCIQSPPYLVSYATYVSATMHARIAVTATQQQQQPAGPDCSVAHRRLRNCLEILTGHQERCHAPRRTLAILLKLMARLEVDVGRGFLADVSRTQPCDISRTDGADEVLHLQGDDNYAQQQQQRLSSCVRSHSPRMMLDDSHATIAAAVGDTGSRTGLSAAEPLQFEGEPISSGAMIMMGQEASTASGMGSDLPAFEYDLGELLPGISFDLDPLFGFDITEMEPGLGS